MMRAFVMSILFSFTLAAQAETSHYKPFGEGLPLPWPFPWAKECPVEWSELNGVYWLRDGDSQELIQLKIRVISREGHRLMKIARFSELGEKLSEGSVWLKPSQRSVNMQLRPVRGDQPQMRARIRFYFDSYFSCSMDRLVPILTLKVVDALGNKEFQFRLIRYSVQ